MIHGDGWCRGGKATVEMRRQTAGGAFESTLLALPLLLLLLLRPLLSRLRLVLPLLQ